MAAGSVSLWPSFETRAILRGARPQGGHARLRMTCALLQDEVDWCVNMIRTSETQYQPVPRGAERVIGLFRGLDNCRGRVSNPPPTRLKFTATGEVKTC